MSDRDAPATGGRMNKQRKVRVGTVKSNKMDKSVVVTVARTLQDPLYRRIVRVNSSYMAHDEDNECKIGDRVRIVETRPRSRRKSWQVAEILERSRIP
jgi:small subunit ribosomal protein S17